MPVDLPALLREPPSPEGAAKVRMELLSWTEVQRSQGELLYAAITEEWRKPVPIQDPEADSLLEEYLLLGAWLGKTLPPMPALEAVPVRGGFQVSREGSLWPVKAAGLVGRPQEALALLGDPFRILRYHPECLGRECAPALVQKIQAKQAEELSLPLQDAGALAAIAEGGWTPSLRHAALQQLMADSDLKLRRGTLVVERRRFLAERLVEELRRVGEEPDSGARLDHELRRLWLGAGGGAEAPVRLVWELLQSPFLGGDPYLPAERLRLAAQHCPEHAPPGFGLGEAEARWDSFRLVRMIQNFSLDRPLELALLELIEQEALRPVENFEASSGLLAAQKLQREGSLHTLSTRAKRWLLRVLEWGAQKDTAFPHLDFIAAAFFTERSQANSELQGALAELWRRFPERADARLSRGLIGLAALPALTADDQRVLLAQLPEMPLDYVAGALGEMLQRSSIVTEVEEQLHRLLASDLHQKYKVPLSKVLLRAATEGRVDVQRALAGVPANLQSHPELAALIRRLRG